jgi:hypothetical protein
LSAQPTDALSSGLLIDAFSLAETVDIKDPLLTARLGEDHGVGLG